MTASSRQAPICKALHNLLDQAAAHAAALIDNAHEDGHPLDSFAATQLRQQLRAIDLLVFQASTTPSS